MPSAKIVVLSVVSAAVLVAGADALALDATHHTTPAFAVPLMLRGSNYAAKQGRASRIAVVAQGPKMQLSSPGGTSVLERKPTIKTAPEENQEQTPDKPYHVLLFNDPMNTREYVCDVLVEIFGHSKSKAYDIMQTAHTSGFAVCNTTDKEEADSQSAKLGDKNLMSSVVQAD